jgi:hypothetical protein
MPEVGIVQLYGQRIPGDLVRSNLAVCFSFNAPDFGVTNFQISPFFAFWKCAYEKRIVTHHVRRKDRFFSFLVIGT